MTKLHKVEILLIDHEEIGVSDLLNDINYVNILKVESLDIEWSDDSILNKISCTPEQALTEYEKHKTLKEE